MALINWQDSYSVKVLEFDTQHQRLVRMLNELHEAMSRREATTILGKLLNGLILYTTTHFAAEEKFMTQHAYPQLKAHQAEHRTLIEQVTQFKQQFDAGQTMLSLSLMSFLKSWLTKHILETDKKYGEFVSLQAAH